MPEVLEFPADCIVLGTGEPSHKTQENIYSLTFTQMLWKKRVLGLFCFVLSFNVSLFFKSR